MFIIINNKQILMIVKILKAMAMFYQDTKYVKC